MHLEYRSHELSQWMLCEIPTNIAQPNLKDWTHDFDLLMLETIESQALGMDVLHCSSLQVICISFGNHELLLRSEVEHEQ